MSEVKFAQVTGVLQNLGVAATKDVLLVDIGEQKLHHFRDGRCLRTYAVSTGTHDPSCREDSGGTPLGLHRIRDRIGDGAPVGAVFKGREPTGRCFWEYSPRENERNLITTRILRLEGLEPDRNRGPGQDSYDRYIYIHGTNREHLIGKPASGGCIQLRNQDMLGLYESVAPGTLVWIGT